MLLAAFNIDIIYVVFGFQCEVLPVPAYY